MAFARRPFQHRAPVAVLGVNGDVVGKETLDLCEVAILAGPVQWIVVKQFAAFVLECLDTGVRQMLAQRFLELYEGVAHVVDI
jgi:hypothetical protein